MKQKNCFRGNIYRFKRFVRKAYSAFNSMHRVVNIGVVTGCMLTFVHTTQATAQHSSGATRDSIPDQDLDEVVVTGSAWTKKVANVIDVYIIPKEEIVQQPAQSVQDLLKAVVGIDVRQRGSNGVQSDISIRGGTSDQVAILLNGVNLSNPQTGHYSFDLPINLLDIERIEIIQGPSSLLYGASAFSGGINIITKKQPDSKAYFKLEGGMHELFGAEANGALKLKESTHQLSAGYNSSEGYIDNSDYKIFNSLWQSHFRSEKSTLDLQAGINSKEYGANTFYSAAYPNQFDDTQSLFFSIRGESGNKIKLIPQLYWNRHWDCFQLFRDGTPSIPSWYAGHNYHLSDVYGFNLNTQYAWSLGILNLGGELRNEGILSNVLGKPLDKPDGKYTKSDNRTNISYFLEQTFLLNQLNVTVGVLADYNTFIQGNFKFYPNINASYSLVDNFRIYASWNNAVRMPTFTDLYYTTKTHIGNSNLLPEKSEAFEVGLKFRNRLLSGNLSGFYVKGKDIIDWVKENPDDLWESQNLTKLNKTGLEINGYLNPEEIYSGFRSTRLNVGYMFLNQAKDANNLISNYAMDYLRHKFTAQLTHPVLKNITANWQFRWQDREGSYTKYDNLKLASEVDYPAYSIFDLKVNWKFRNFNIYASANNLFDVSYYDLGNIPQPGFWFIGGANYIIP